MKKALLMLVVLSLAGCMITPSTTCFVDVSSFARSDIGAKKTYVLRPRDTNVSPEDLQFIEFAAYVERALAQHGLQRSNDLATAEMAIAIAYGIGEPTQRVTGYSTSQQSIPAYSPYAPTMAQTKTTAQYATTYTRYVNITAYDFSEYRNTNKEKTLWELKMSSTGGNGDLRQVFPMMIAAALPYVGKDTGRIINVAISEDDKAIQQVKGTLAPKAK